MTASTAAQADDPRDVGSSHHGPGFWVGLVVGGAVMLLAVLSVYRELTFSSFFSWGKWVVGADLLNDALILPLVALVGIGVTRLPLGRALAPVQAGLFATAILAFIAYPGVTEQSTSDNPTIQPLNYATATLTVLVVVWGLVAVWALARRRSTPPSASAGDDGR